MNHKRLFVIPLTLLSLTSFSFSTLYFDGEDGAVGDWHVYDNTPAGATVSNILDNVKNSNVIELKGDGRFNSYILGNKDWANSTEKNLKWSMNFSEKFKIVVYLSTSKGIRTLFYDHNNHDKGLYNTKYIKIGLGSKSMSGTWQNISRNIEADLKQYEPNNSLLEIKGLKVQGSGRMDNIRLGKDGDVPPPPPPPPPNNGEELYEDAEDGSTKGWIVYDNNPAGATISNIRDEDKNSNVIKLKGEGRSNDYLFGEKTSNDKSDAHTLSWSMKIKEKYKITVYTSTEKGRRMFVFTHSNGSRGLYGDKYIHTGLKTKSMDNSWQEFSFDLDEKLKEYEADNKLLKISGFKVQGSGLFDDIKVIGNNNPPPQHIDHLAVPNDYRTLVDAVAHAEDGDTIILDPGTYYISETITVKQKNLTVASKYHTTGNTSYIERTIIKGTGDKNSKRFLEAESSNLKLIGITGTNFGKFIVFNYGNGNLVDHCKMIDINGDAVSFDSTAGGKVLHSFIDLSGDDAIDVDSKVQGEFEFAYNTLLHSHDDGIEIHLWKDRRNNIVKTMHFNIHDNVINFSHKDGIQLIDFEDTTNRTFNISNNTFSNNGHVAVGAIFEKTNHSLAETNFSGTSMKESVKILNNIFDSNRYHLLGGDNMEVKGNTFKNASKVAIKRVKGSSVIENNTFSNNAVDRIDSN